MPTMKKQHQADYAARRRGAVRQAAKLAKADSFLITQPEDVRYLSGFTGEDAFLLVGRSWAVLLTDGRFAEQAPAECPGVEVLVRKGPMSTALAEQAKSHKTRKIAFQAEHVRVSWRGAFEKALGTRRLLPTTGAIATLRQIKDAGEVAAIERSAAVAQKAFRELIGQGRDAFIGRTERQIAGELEYGAGRRSCADVAQSAFRPVLPVGALLPVAGICAELF